MDVKLSGTANMSVKLKRFAVIATGALLLTAPPAILAQSPDKTVHIGILVGGMPGAARSSGTGAPAGPPRAKDMSRARNLVLERRYADGRAERTPEFARELAAMKLDAVVTTCTPSTRAAQQVLGSTPIVMAAVADPVGQHLIASLARPGANITGLSSQAEDIMPKIAGAVRECPAQADDGRGARRGGEARYTANVASPDPGRASAGYQTG
jgi:putative ABC transport system substrate-binding protein